MNLNNIATVANWVDTHDFISTPQIDVQRDVSSRVKKIRGLLEKTPLPNHVQVASVTYPDPTSPQVRIKRSVDGHGRKEVWLEQESEGTKIPQMVLETTYAASSYEEAVNVYYAIDSQSSVETSGDKFTGVASKLGLDFDTTKLKKGGIGKALEYAAKNTKYLADSSRLNDITRYPVVLAFKESLLHLDSLAISPKNKRFRHQAMWSAALMIIAKHGFTPRVQEGLYRLQNGDINSTNVDPVEADAMTLINVEWGKPRDEGELANCRGLTDGKSLPLQLDFLLFHWSQWLTASPDNQRYSRNKWKKQKSRAKSKYRNNHYYVNHWFGTDFAPVEQS